MRIWHGKLDHYKKQVDEVINKITNKNYTKEHDLDHNDLGTFYCFGQKDGTESIIRTAVRIIINKNNKNNTEMRTV